MGTPQNNGKTKAPVWAIGVVLLIAGAGTVAYQARDLVTNRSAGSGTQAFYTTDDGKTLFGQEPSALPPFDHDGKPAVLAHVYRCDGKQFVAYLERYTPEALKAVAQLKAASGAKPGPDAPKIDPRTIQLATTGAGREVKTPGDANWVPRVGSAGNKVTDVKCPHGKGSSPEPVTP